MPASRHRAEQAINRSRFICTIDRVEAATEAQQLLREMGEEFPDATHSCWAYLIGRPGSTDRIGMSDAGEPHGTAGRPMLTVLQHSGVGDIAAVVTRYYGGTNLGNGGLVKAYGGTVQLALATMPRRERIEYAEMTVVAGYENISAVLQLIPRFEADVLAEDYGVRVTIRLRVPLSVRAEFERALRDATRGQIELIDSGVAPGYL
ncbi:MAG TPA: YigZ family protein [Gemmatimonadaceae bacterium]|nr:YigZ family protein [Gemmatimonadaceae bacterium]